MENLLKQLLQLAIFSAFIHAIIEVVKGASIRGIFGVIKEISIALVKSSPISEESMKTLIFALSLLYCWAFDFGAMTAILGVKIEDTNSFAWWLDYIGTSSVIYVGVDIFYGYIKKLQNQIKAVDTVTTTVTDRTTQESSVAVKGS